MKKNSKKVPKIWIINQFANTPNMPGGTRHYEIGKYFAKLNWDVEVFSSDFNLSSRKYMILKDFQLWKTEKHEGFQWHWLRTLPYKQNNYRRYLNLVSFSFIFFIRQFFVILFDSILKNRPNVIIASSPQLPAAFFSLILAKIFKTTFIFEVRDIWPQVLIDLGGLKKESFLIRFLYWMESKLYKNSDCVVVLAKGAKKYVLKKGANKVIWLPNGPDLKEFKPLPFLKEPLNFTEKEPFKIIYTGAHGLANDLINIVETAKIMNKEPVKFTLVGDGPEKRNLIKQAKNLDNINFLSPVPKLLIPELIANYNAILISLKGVRLFEYGISPNKLYDAYALARPVISTVKGFVNKEINEFNLGCTALPGDPNSLSKAIKKLIMLSKNDRKEMGRRGRELAVKIYSRDKINKLYAELIMKLIMKK